MHTDPLKRRILIGEADPIHRVRLEQLLNALGYSVEICADGLIALGLLKTVSAPFVALLDFDLPGLSCPEICRELSRHNPEPSSWIIAMCGEMRQSNSGLYSSAANSHNARIVNSRILEAGMCDVLAKPVGELELRLRLKTAERVQAVKEELERSVEAISFQASHDPLTGLWNREALLPLLFQETDRVRRTSAPMALMLIDLDHFMHRNLEFGYGVCDSVLRQIAVRLRRQLRSYDILGRSGEDEFLVALPGCGLDDAIAMAERLRVRVLHSPFRARDVSLTVHASFGVAQSGGRSPLIVMREAERALTAAKQAGRDRVRYLGPEPPLANALRVPLHENTMDLHEPPEARRLSFFPSPSSGKPECGR